MKSFRLVTKKLGNLKLASLALVAAVAIQFVVAVPAEAQQIDPGTGLDRCQFPIRDAGICFQPIADPGFEFQGAVFTGSIIGHMPIGE